MKLTEWETVVAQARQRQVDREAELLRTQAVERRRIAEQERRLFEGYVNSLRDQLIATFGTQVFDLLSMQYDRHVHGPGCGPVTASFLIGEDVVDLVPAVSSPAYWFLFTGPFDESIVVTSPADDHVFNLDQLMLGIDRLLHMTVGTVADGDAGRSS